MDIFFLPRVVPIRFTGKVTSNFKGGVRIFLFPVLLFVVALLAKGRGVGCFLARSGAFLASIRCGLVVSNILKVVLVTRVCIVCTSFIWIFPGGVSDLRG